MANKALDDFLTKYGDYKPKKREQTSSFEDDYNRRKTEDAYSSWEKKYGNPDVVANYNRYIDDLNSYSQRINEYAGKSYASWDEYKNDTTGEFMRNYLKQMRERNDIFNSALSSRSDIQYSPDQYKGVSDYLSGLEKNLDSIKEYWDAKTPYKGYEQYEDMPDFEEKSAYKTTDTGKKSITYAGYGGGGMPALYTYGSKFDDALYDAVNGNSAAATEYGASTGKMFDADAFRFIDDYQKKVFNYIYATEGRDAARNFLRQIMPSLTEQNMAEFKKSLTDSIKEGGVPTAVAGSILSGLMAPMKGISYIGQGMDYLTSGKIDTNAGYNVWSAIPNAIRGEVSQEILDAATGRLFPDMTAEDLVGKAPQVLQKLGGMIKERNDGWKAAIGAGMKITGDAIDAAADKVAKGTWGDIGTFGYQTAMSMMDFLMNMAISRAAVGGQVTEATMKAAETISLMLMGTGAAADSVIEAKERGMSDRASFLTGSLAGLAEILSEKVSVEALLDPKRFSDGMLKYWVKNTVSEGLEEGESDIMNWLVDGFYTIMTDEPTQFRTDMQNYMSQGYNEQEAFIRVIVDRAGEMGQDILGGAISGGVMAGAQNIQDFGLQWNTGRALQESGMTNDTLNLPEGIDQDSALYKLAQELQQRQQNGGIIMPNELGRLDILNQETMSEADQAINKGIEEQNTDDVLKNLRSSGPLSQETLEAIKSNPYAMRELGIDTKGDVDEQIRTALQGREAKSSSVVRNYVSEVSNKIRTTATQAFDKNMVKAYSETLGKAGAQSLQDMFSSETQDADKYIYNAVQYYNQGVNGETFEFKQSSYINELQARAMYEAGKIDNENGGVKNEGNVSVSGSGQRTSGENPVVESSGVEGRPGGAEGWKTNRKAADTSVLKVRVGTEEVTAESLGLAHGTSDAKVRLVEDGFSRKMRKAINRAKKAGFNLHLFVGGNLSFAEAKTDAARNDYTDRWEARGLVQGKDIYIRADDTLYTADLIAGHELAHEWIKSGPNGNIGEIWDKFAKNLTGEQLDKIVSVYARDFVNKNGELVIGMDELKVEIVCDAVGGMNPRLFTDMQGQIELIQEGMRDVAKEFKETGSIQEGTNFSRSLDTQGNELTEEQQDFFEDSVIRDSKGRLRVLYHGTTANFTKFRIGDVGYHFGNKTTARTRVGRGTNARLMEVYLNITNPIRFDTDLGSWDADYRLTKELQSRGILTADEAGQVLRVNGRARSTGDANRTLRDMLLSKGYDGIIYKNYHEAGGSDSYIAFLSSQVKSTNNPTPTSDQDIRYSIVSTSRSLGVEASRDENGKVMFTVDGVPVDKVDVAHVKHNSAIGLLIKTALDNKFIDAEMADEQYQAAADLMNMILKTQDPELTWAWAGAAMFSSLKKNSDGQYGTTIDFTTVCRKTQEMLTAMSNAMKEKGAGLTKDEVVELQYKVNESGAEVPCPVCYVFSRWAGVGGMLDDIVRLQDMYEKMGKEQVSKTVADLKKQIIAKGWDKNGKVTNSEITKLMKEYQETYENAQYMVEQYEKGNLNKLTQEQYKEYKVTAKTLKENIDIMSKWTWFTQIVTRKDYKAVPKDILFDLDAGKAFAEKYPAVWKYRTTRGPSSGKAILPYSDMRYGDIIIGAEPTAKKSRLFTNADGTIIYNDHMSPDQKKAVKAAVMRTAAQNLIGGQRFQSTSDFRYEYALDYIQAFWELQAIGSKMQTYTKVVEFADIVAAIGGDVNLSVMPLRSGIDENGHLIFSPVTGMNIDAALEANRKFDNAQLILVGINDKHILAALDDHHGTGGEFIGFVIPYHTSGASIDEYIAVLVRNLGEDYQKNNYLDYSPVQSDRARADATEIEKKRAAIREKILKGRGSGVNAKRIILTEEDMILIQGKNADITGRTFEDLRSVELKALAGDKAALKDYLSWSAGVLNDLYEKMYNGPEQKTFLSSTQAEHIMPHEYWNTNTTRSNAYVNGFIFRSYCHRLGLQPRFSWTVGTGAKAHGDLTSSDGYWKVLIDRPMYNNDGTYREQQRINVTEFNNAMLTQKYAEETYPGYKLQEPNLSRAEKVGRQFGKDLKSAQFSRVMNPSYSALFEDMQDGRIKLKSIEDVSTEDWQMIAKTVKKLGYDIRSAADAKKAYKYADKHGFNKEQSDAIKKAYGVTDSESDLSANPKREALARKTYGTTGDFREAGYLMRNGAMLDFSGKKEGGPGHVRYMDHREINRVFSDGEIPEEKTRYGNNTAYMNAFINEGNIRLMDGQGVTIGEMEPTAQQYTILKQFIDHVLKDEDYFYLDLSNRDGSTIESRDYSASDGSAKIIREIKSYFKNGELPYRSGLSQFYSRVTDSDGKKLSVKQEEYFKDSKVRDENGNLLVMYHGTNSPGFTVFDPQYSDDKTSLFFTSNPEMANTYTELQDKGKDLDVYNLVTEKSTADEFNKAAKKIGSPYRVVKITPEWLEKRKSQFMAKLEELQPYIPDLIDSADGMGMPLYAYQEKALGQLFEMKVAPGSWKDSYDALSSVLWSGGQYFNYKTKDERAWHRKFDKTAEKIRPIKNALERYGIAYDIPDSAVGSYIYEAEKPSEWSEYEIGTHGHGFSGGAAFGDEKYAVTKALERVSNLPDRTFGNRYKVYLNITNPYVLEGGQKLKGEYDVAAKLDWDENLKFIFVDPKTGEEVWETTVGSNTINSEAETRRLIGDDAFARLDKMIQDNEGDPGKFDLGTLNIDTVIPGVWHNLTLNGEMGKKTRDVVKYAKENGHDGVIFKNIRDNGGFSGGYDAGPGTVAVAFDSNQVKSVDNMTPTKNPDIRFSRVTDQDKIRELESGKTIKVYRAMQMIDGKLYPPMAAKVKDESGKTQLVEPQEIGVWYRADERPDLIRNGKFTLNKGNGSSIEAAYNPYFHTSLSPLNDQFSSAYKRPNLVIVEAEVPESELTSGYRAEGAKDSVGEMNWHSGPVSSQLKGEKARRVILSRWLKVTRVLSDAEVAGRISELLEGENIVIPDNVVTPSLRDELLRNGIKVKGSQMSRTDTANSLTYAALSAKDPMHLATVDDNKAYYGVMTREDIVNAGLSNARENGWEDKDGRAFVYVDDLHDSVAVPRESLRHGLDRRVDKIAPATVKVGEILKNAIRINEVTPESQFASDAFVLLGAAKGTSGRIHIVEFVVNKYTNEVEDIINLYSLNAKKEPAALSAPQLSLVTGSELNIADLLEIASRNFPDVLPEDVLRHFGFESRPEGKLGRSALYSRVTPNIDALAAENRELKKEMTKIRQKLNAKTEQAAKWKAEAHTSTGPVLNQKVLGEVAEELLKSNQSTVNKKDLTGKLDSLAKQILTTTEDENWYENARESAMQIANEINENTKVLTEGEQFYKDFKKDLKSGIFVSPKARSEVAPDGWDAFRKRYFGSINFSSNGKSVDTVYTDLSREYGEWLFPEDITAEADQLNKIIEVLDTYSPVYDNRNVEEAAMANEWVTDEIMTRLMGMFETGELRQDGKTRADKWQEQLRNEKEWSQKTLKEVRQRRDEREAALREHYQEMAKRRREDKVDSEMRDKLLRIARRLANKKLDPVNAALRDRYIGDLDLVAKSITKQKLADLRALEDWYLQEKERDENFFRDEDIEKQLQRLHSKHIKDLTQDEVVTLTKILLYIENETRLRDSGELIDSAVNTDRYVAGMETIDDVASAKGRKGSKGWQKISEFFVDNQLAAIREVRRITDYHDDDPMLQLTREVSKGYTKKIGYGIEANKAFKQWLTDKKFLSQFAGKDARKIYVKGAVGMTAQRYEITPAMAVGLYLSSLNDDNMRHISQGGIQIPDMTLYRKGDIKQAYEKGQIVKFQRSAIQEVRNQLTDDEKKFANAAWTYFNVTAPTSVNRVSMKLVGYEKATEKNYYRIDTLKTFLNKEISSVQQAGTPEGQGSLKERTHNATNPIVLFDVNEVLQRAIDENGTYVGLAIPIRNFNTLYNTRVSLPDGDIASIKDVITNRWGEAADHYLNKMILDAQNKSTKVDSIFEQVVSKARSNEARAALFFNIGVAIKQAASLPTAAATLGWKPIAKAISSLRKVDPAQIAKYSPLYEYRALGYSTPEMGEVGKRNNSLPKALQWIEAIDLWTVRRLWRAAEYYAAENTSLAVGSDEYYQAVKDIWEQTVQETQPNYTPMERAQALRSQGVERALHLFKTQPYQNFGILYDALHNLVAKQKQFATNSNEQTQARLKEAKVQFARAVGSQLAASFVFSLMQWAVDMLRGKGKKYKDPDKDEATFLSWLKGMGISMASNGFGMIPLGGLMMEVVESSTDEILKAADKDPFFNQSYYGLSEPTIDAINSAESGVINLVKKISKFINGDNNAETFARGMVDLANEAAALAGVPSGNATRALKSIARIATIGLSSNKLVGEYYALRITTDPSKYKSDYYDLLYKAYTTDRDAYNEILTDMQSLDGGDTFKEDNIKDAIEERMKKDAGVDSVKILPKRWLPSDAEIRYNEDAATIENSKLWSQATDEQKESLQTKLYNLALGNSSGQKMQEKIDEGKSVGIDETEYLLYQLALQIYDVDQNKSYTNDETENAIRSIPGLSDAERDFLWYAAGKKEKNKPNWR